jgi:proteasome accessory factor B
MSASLAPREPDCSAVVLARSGAANGLRRRAAVTATGVTGPDGTPGWDQLHVPYVSEADFAGELLGYADAVVVESPDELRAAVRDRLSSVLAGGAR